MKREGRIDFRIRPYPEPVSERQTNALANELETSCLVAELLCRRGITTGNQAKEFFSPRLQNLPSPFAMLNMEKAVGMITEAMEKRSPVLVWGDYDVDGVCSTALLVHFLKKLQLNVSWHIPNRLTEGYGLCAETMDRLAGQIRNALLITVDNGISAVEEVRAAREAGFKILITDHHEPPSRLPEADCIVNPRQQGCGFPCKDLSGSGVAFFLTGAVRGMLRERGYWEKRDEPDIREYLDLVAMGTVADVMSLTGINRILVRTGCEILSRKNRPGVMALCELAGLHEGPVTTEDISYRLGPRVNAAGRMGSPMAAAELFMCEDMAEARVFAKQLEEMNLRRREIEAKILPLAVAQSQKQIDPGEKTAAKGLVVYGADWHQGVIGIIASKLTELFRRPVIVLTDDPSSRGVIKGSGRTVGSTNLFAAVNGCAEYLEKYGGHPKAVGLSLRKEHLEKFRTAFNREIERQDREGVLGRQCVVDHRIEDGAEVDRDFFSMLRKFEPFGENNPEPIFLVEEQRLRDLALIKGEHLRFSLQLNGTTFRGIGFGMGEHLDLARKNAVNLAFTFKHSVFRGQKRIEVMAVAIDPTL